MITESILLLNKLSLPVPFRALKRNSVITDLTTYFGK